MAQLFSPNMLKTYELCPKKFYFRYIKNITMPTDDEIFELGKNIHAIASYYLKKENISKMETSLNSKEAEIWNSLKNIEYFSYKTIETEYNLSVRVDKYYFGGRLDALLKNNDEYIILDYKTGSAPKNATYDFQTMIYLLAVASFYKTSNVTFIYLDLKNRSEVKIKLTEELATEYKKILLDTTRKIETKEYNKKYNKDCNCEYEIICY